jgi:hypothetical protein
LLKQFSNKKLGKAGSFIRAISKNKFLEVTRTKSVEKSSSCYISSFFGVLQIRKPKSYWDII